MNQAKLKRCVIKEELVALTGDFKQALVLNQLLYWSERVKDFDQFIEEENSVRTRGGLEPKDKYYGWIFKSAEQLSEETMLGLSKSNMRSILKKLLDKGYIEQRKNPHYNWDRTLQYRVNLSFIQKELQNLGYALEGYPLLVNTEEKPTRSGSSKTEHRCSNSESPGRSKTEHHKFYNETAIPETTIETTSDITNTQDKSVCLKELKAKYGSSELSIAHEIAKKKNKHNQIAFIQGILERRVQDAKHVLKGAEPNQFPQSVKNLMKKLSGGAQETLKKLTYRYFSNNTLYMRSPTHAYLNTDSLKKELEGFGIKLKIMG